MNTPQLAAAFPHMTGAILLCVYLLSHFQIHFSSRFRATRETGGPYEFFSEHPLLFQPKSLFCLQHIRLRGTEKEGEIYSCVCVSLLYFIVWPDSVIAPSEILILFSSHLFFRGINFHSLVNAWNLFRQRNLGFCRAQLFTAKKSFWLRDAAPCTCLILNVSFFSLRLFQFRERTAFELHWEVKKEWWLCYNLGCFRLLPRRIGKLYTNYLTLSPFKLFWRALAQRGEAGGTHGDTCKVLLAW